MSHSVQESKMSFSVYVDDEQEDITEEDMNEERLHKKDKKRRLTSDQVNFLEDSFEKESKLEPERKLFIAKHLGLQPRQVAVWFQNRRARWKTKQLEHDYDSMKARYLALLKDNEKLQVEVAALTDILERKKGVSETGDFPLLNEQGNTSLVLSPTAAHPSIQEQSVEKAKDLYSKSDVQSPTKSGESEELDSHIYVPPSESSLLRMVTGAVPGLFSDGLLEGIYNPTFLQQVVVKLEENVFQEENCGLILGLEELGLFPLYD